MSTGGRPWQVVVSGYTGATAGEYPKSWWRVAALVLVVLAVALLILSLQE